MWYYSPVCFNNHRPLLWRVKPNCFIPTVFCTPANNPPKDKSILIIATGNCIFHSPGMLLTALQMCSDDFRKHSVRGEYSNHVYSVDWLFIFAVDLYLIVVKVNGSRTSFTTIVVEFWKIFRQENKSIWQGNIDFSRALCWRCYKIIKKNKN